MSFEYSNSSTLYLPDHVNEELEHARTIEHRDFKRISVEAKLGNVGLGCLYYQPEEAIDNTAIGIVKGLGAPRGVYLGLAEALAKRGRPVFLYKSPRTQPLLDLVHPEHQRDPLIYQMQAVHAVAKALRNSEEVTELRGGNPVHQIDLGGHSMGNYIMVSTAYHDIIEKPSEDISIRTITSIAGAGLDGDGGMKQVAQHAKKLWPGIAVDEIWKGLPLIIKSAPKDIKIDAIQHIFRSLPRILRETAKIVWSPGVREKIENVDIPYGAILPENDQFFYWQKVLQKSGDLFDNNYEVIKDANHVYPNSHPEEFAPHLIAMTHALAKNRHSQRYQA